VPPLDALARLVVLGLLVLLARLAALAAAARGSRRLRRGALDGGRAGCHKDLQKERGSGDHFPAGKKRKTTQRPAGESAQAQPSQRDHPRTEGKIGRRMSPNEWAENAPQLNRTHGPSGNALTHH